MKKRPQHGMSLIELMVGLAIGTVSVLAAITIFTSSQVASNATHELSDIDESSRILANNVQNSISQAGYYGCQTRSGHLQNNIASSTSSYLYNFAQPLYGWESDGSTFKGPNGSVVLDTSISSTTPAPPVSLKSDVLAIRTASGTVAKIDIASTPPGNIGTVYLSPNNWVGTTIDKAVLMISNCSRTTAFINTAAASCSTSSVCAVDHAAGAGAAPGNSTGNSDVGFNYGYDAEVFSPSTTTFFVANSQRCIAGATGARCPSYSLYQKTGSSSPVETVPNVWGMKVTYYADSGSGMKSGDIAYTAANVPDLTKVVGLKIDFLVVGSKPILTEATAYLAPFSSSFSADKYAKRIVSIKINFRNTMP